MEEDDDLGKTLAVSRFGDLISKPPAWDPEKPSRSYSERDFESDSTFTFFAEEGGAGVDEEEEEEEEEGESEAEPAEPPPPGSPPKAKFSIGSDEDDSPGLSGRAAFTKPLPSVGPSSDKSPQHSVSSPSPRARVSRVTGEKGRPWSPSASYDLRERLCPGSALGGPGGPEQQVPTDEAEAQMLGSADLDDMKSE
ncbi:hypothetical protein MJT46_003970 [Ovis ammon polii x Ovis aries]|nr:hypothetical protein MJT46_003970 [Ovis ammon polii x Ovis aries]